MNKGPNGGCCLFACTLYGYLSLRQSTTVEVNAFHISWHPRCVDDGRPVALQSLGSSNSSPTNHVCSARGLAFVAQIPDAVSQQSAGFGSIHAPSF